MSTSNFLGGLFGQMPSYIGGLLSPEEQEKLKQEAQNQGVLNLGLSLLAGSGRSPVRRTTGELVAQGLQAGQQAYRGATQQAIQDKMLGLQFAEMAKKQRAEQALPGLIESAMVAPQREFTDLERMEMRTPSVATGPAQFNPQQFLQRAAAVGVSPSVAIPLGQQIQSFTTPKTVKLGAGEALVEESTGREVAARAKPAEYKTFTTDAGTFAYDVNNPTASFKIADAAGETYTGDAATVAKSLYGSAKVAGLTQEQRNAILKGTAELKSSSSTKIVMPGEKLTNKTMEKFGEQYPSMLTQAVSADQTNQRLASIIENKNQKMYTGLLAPGQIAAAQFLQSFGLQVDPEKLAIQELRKPQQTNLRLTSWAQWVVLKGSLKKNLQFFMILSPRLLMIQTAGQRLLKCSSSETIKSLMISTASGLLWRNTKEVDRYQEEKYLPLICQKLNKRKRLRRKSRVVSHLALELQGCPNEHLQRRDSWTG